MLDADWEGMLARAAEEVLETMFFSAVYGPAEPGSPDAGPRLAARLAFEGLPSGALTLSLSEPSARTLAANFLAGEPEDSIADSQLGGIVCELANMICGDLLSQVESQAHFRLSSPELLPAGMSLPSRPNQSLDLGDGTLDLWLAVHHDAN